MLPTYNRLNRTKPVLIIPFGKYAVYVLCLPLLSFIFCILCSLLFFFHESTYTHCEVINYLPSISAAIGNYQPQRLLWQSAICLDFLPRLIITRMYIEYYQETIRINRRFLAYFACILNVIENFALLGLSLWTSNENYDMHKACFLTFIASSEIYMLISYYLNKNAKKIFSLTREQQISLTCKRNLFATNVIAFSLAGYCFLRHNERCERGVYTLFALFEYIVVITNMGYHMTAYWDFYGRSLTFDWDKGLYFTHF